MLSDEEKEEMKALAQSSRLREEFRSLRRLSQEKSMSPDQFLDFLTAVNRMVALARPCRFVAYQNIRL